MDGILDGVLVLPGKREPPAAVCIVAYAHLHSLTASPVCRVEPNLNLPMPWARLALLFKVAEILMDVFVSWSVTGRSRVVQLFR